jgi:MFS family permease
VSDAPAVPMAAAGRVSRLAFLFMAHGICTANFAIILAEAPAIEQSLGLNHATFGVLVSGYYGGLLACSVPAGVVVDRLGIRLSLALAYALSGVGLGLFALSHSMAPAMVGLAFCGAGYSLINPATARGILAWFSLRGRATAMGTKQTGVPAGGLVAALAAAATSDWKMLAAVISVATLAAAAGCLALRLAEPSSATPVRFSDVRVVLQQPRLMQFNIAASMYGMAQGAFLAYLVLFAGDAMGAAPAVASLCLGATYVAAAVGRIFWGFVSDRIARNGRLVSLVSCGVASAASVGLLVIIPKFGGLAVLPFLAAVIGFTLSGYAGLTQTVVAESVDPKITGAAIGFNLLMTNTGMMLGPVMFGAGVQFLGYGPSWIFLVALVLLAAGMFRMMYVPPRAAP